MEALLKFIQTDKNLSKDFKKRIKENTQWKNKQK